MKLLRFAVVLLLAIPCVARDLTGNWAVKEPRGDGTFRTTYLDLKQDGDKVTGHIRTTQFYFTIWESASGPDGYTLTAGMQDGKTKRQTKYIVKLEGDELHVTWERRPNQEPVQMTAHAVPEGEGAMPEKLPLPALHKVPYNGLAKTPPMGWNSWNKFAGRVTEDDVRGAADAMVSSGMKAAGYVYVNIDDTWQGERDAQGNIHANKKFPDMKALADYVHSKGLKIGIYSSPGPNTCAGYEGSYGHEEQDAKTYAEWGIDYLKYDWCGARNIYTNEEMQPVYQKMGDALEHSGRKIVYSLCQYGLDDVWKWGPEVGGNLWRTTGDIRDQWASMTRIGFSQDELAPYAAPGHWNDPDMLEIGNGGMTNDEYKTHMSLWSMLAAPLLAGNDLRAMSPEIGAILMNREVIAVDQDKEGKQGRRVKAEGEQEVWSRPLEGGALAVGLFNRGPEAAKISVKWSELGLKKAPKKVRDLWEHKDVKVKGDAYTAEVASHGVAMIRIGK